MLIMPDFSGGSVIKNPPVDAGDLGDVGLMPGSGISPAGGSRSYSSILAWKISWTEEPGRLWSLGSIGPKR